MLKAIHAQEDAQAAKDKAQAVVEKLEAMKLSKAAEKVREGIDETLSYHDFPRATPSAYLYEQSAPKLIILLRTRRGCILNTGKWYIITDKCR